ncbi:MAG: hypothetical protein QOF32_2363, partial [Gammaproteobacteria bacterium]|nr:hypothetical protein [Gammaproteobacteria bacterium]
ADILGTYSNLRRECDELADIAQKIEAIARERERFRDDAEFQQLKALFLEKFVSVTSLASV